MSEIVKVTDSIQIDPVENGSALMFRNTINKNFENISRGFSNIEESIDSLYSEIWDKINIYVQSDSPYIPFEGDLWLVSGDVGDKKSGEWYRYSQYSWVKVENSDIDKLNIDVDKLNSLLVTKQGVEYIDGTKVVDIPGDSLNLTQQELKEMIEWDNFNDNTKQKIEAYENPKYYNILKSKENTTTSTFEVKDNYIKLGSAYILSSKPSSTSGYEEGSIIFVVG